MSSNSQSAVLFEVGSCWIKCGIVGSNQPHAVVASPASLTSALSGCLLQPLNCCALTGQSQPSAVEARLVDELAQVFGTLYSQTLLLKTSAHRVVIVEAFFVPQAIRSVLSKVFLEVLGAPFIKFVQSPMACAISSGRQTALVVDIGATDSRIIPVVLGQVMVEAAQATAIAPSALHAVAADLLLTTLFTSGKPSGSAPISPPQRPTRAVVQPGLAYEHLGLDFCPYGDGSPALDGLRDHDIGLASRNSPNDGGLRCKSSGLEGMVARWIEKTIRRHGSCSHRSSQLATKITLDIPVQLARCLAIAPTKPGNPSAATGTAASLPTYSVDVDADAWQRVCDMPFDCCAAHAVTAATRQICSDADVAAASQSESHPHHQRLLIPLLTRARKASALISRSEYTPTHIAVGDAIRLSPLDARKAVAASIVCNGGFSSMPGFALRLLKELAANVYPSFDITASLKAQAAGTSLKPTPAPVGRVSGGSAALTCLRPLLPYLSIANLFDPSITAYCGASTLAHALATTPRLVHAKTVGGSGSGNAATGSVASTLVKSDALTESSISRSDWLAIARPAESSPRRQGPASVAASDLLMSAPAFTPPMGDGPLPDLCVAGLVHDWAPVVDHFALAKARRAASESERKAAATQRSRAALASGSAASQSHAVAARAKLLAMAQSRSRSGSVASVASSTASAGSVASIRAGVAARAGPAAHAFAPTSAASAGVGPAATPTHASCPSSVVSAGSSLKASHVLSAGVGPSPKPSAPRISAGSSVVSAASQAGARTPRSSLTGGGSALSAGVGPSPMTATKQQRASSLAAAPSNVSASTNAVTGSTGAATNLPKVEPGTGKPSSAAPPLPPSNAAKLAALGARLKAATNTVAAKK